MPPSPARATPVDPAPTLSAQGLGGQRGERPLFRGLDLVLPPGSVVWLRGRNGRGKTSLLRVLAGLSAPARGELRLGGQPLKSADAPRHRLLYVAHANALKDDLTATEALRFLGSLPGRAPSPAEVAAALACLGVPGLARAAVRTLSQGQRRRVALARLALPQPPSVWLLDEPFDALDDAGVQTLNALLSEHAAAGGSALLTSHQALSLHDPAPRVLNLDDFAIHG